LMPPHPLANSRSAGENASTASFRSNFTAQL
jgi:hypothetical protein